MPGLRYHQPAVCDYLASQYVAGAMTQRVRSRMDVLVSTVPELRAAVAFWADQLSSLQYQLPEQQPSAETWHKIAALTNLDLDSRSTDQADTMAATDHPSVSEPPPASALASVWRNLPFWQCAGLVGVTASVLLTTMLVLTPALPPQAPSYMAAMAPHQSASAEVHFVVTAYGKRDNEPSKLVVQWSERHPREDQSRLHLWAENLQSGDVTYIGREPESGQPWALTKAHWQTVAASSRLLMTRDLQPPQDSNTVFSGQCVQLTPWQSGAS